MIGFTPGRTNPDRSGRWLAFVGMVAIALGLAGLLAGGPWHWLALLPLAVLAIALLDLTRRHAALKGELAQSRTDYRQLVDLPAQATFVCDPQGHFLFISERYTSWTGLDLEATESEWTSIIHPEDRDAVVAGWNRALATGQPHDQEHRVRHVDGRYRWKRARAWPQLGEDGRVSRWVGQVEDIHERRLARDHLRQTAGLLEMIGSSTESIIWAKDRDCRMLYINRALERLAGVTLGEVLGKTDAEWNPDPAQADAFTAADRRVLESGQPDDVEEVFTAHNGTMRRYRSIRSPLRDRSGAVIGVVGVATDITERREAAEREQLLARELDHRAKNLLAVVQSVLALTRATSLEAFRTAVEGRIQALGRAHSMLSASRWEGADLHRIVAEELAPYAGSGNDRVEVVGPALVLKPAAAQSLSLVVHELATNAAKYGALSTAAGTVQVLWEVATGLSRSPELRLTWTERGGPLVASPAGPQRKGFGSRLIRGSIERQLGGRLSLQWSEEGLAATIEVPVHRTLAGESYKADPERSAPQQVDAA
jgi:PAS domain S-box-containing protein